MGNFQHNLKMEGIALLKCITYLSQVVFISFSFPKERPKEDPPGRCRGLCAATGAGPLVWARLVWCWFSWPCFYSFCVVFLVASLSLSLSCHASFHHYCHSFLLMNRCFHFHYIHTFTQIWFDKATFIVFGELGGTDCTCEMRPVGQVASPLGLV